jgi:hypothetical protein
VYGLRHDLETFKKRLKALEAKVAQDGLILTEAQVAALERKKEEEQSKGEIETHHRRLSWCTGYILCVCPEW